MAHTAAETMIQHTFPNMFSLRKIDPKIRKTSDSLSFTTVEPNIGKWVLLLFRDERHRISDSGLIYKSPREALTLIDITLTLMRNPSPNWKP